MQSRRSSAATAIRLTGTSRQTIPQLAKPLRSRDVTSPAIWSRGGGGGSGGGSASWQPAVAQRGGHTWLLELHSHNHLGHLQQVVELLELFAVFLYRAYDLQAGASNARHAGWRGLSRGRRVGWQRTDAARVADDAPDVPMPVSPNLNAGRNAARQGGGTLAGWPGVRTDARARRRPIAPMARSAHLARPCPSSGA
jgi:hypothetical protein